MSLGDRLPAVIWFWIKISFLTFYGTVKIYFVQNSIFTIVIDSFILK